MVEIDIIFVKTEQEITFENPKSMQITPPFLKILLFVMRLKRKFQKTHLTRPRKGGAAKRRRQNDQKKRLVALGMDEETVRKMSPREVLTLLKYPLKVKGQSE